MTGAKRERLHSDDCFSTTCTLLKSKKIKGRDRVSNYQMKNPKKEKRNESIVATVKWRGGRRERRRKGKELEE